MYRVVGVDEAGKGPVIGSLVIGFAIINLEKKEDLDAYQEKLKALGVRDSKKLTPKKRRELYHELKNYLDMKFIQLTPALIDMNNKRGGKLNELEIEAIVKVLSQEEPELVIIDSLTALPEKFGREIKSRLNFDCEIISENKADDTYPLVGAASIVAKELREEEIKQIKENLGVEIGSGYPSDPLTVKFLKENWNKKEYDFLFRKSWETYQKLTKKEGLRRLDEFVDKV